MFKRFKNFLCKKEIKELERLQNKYTDLLANKGRMYQVVQSQHKDMISEVLWTLRDHDGATYYSIYSLLKNGLGNIPFDEDAIITIVIDKQGDNPDDAFDKGW